MPAAPPASPSTCSERDTYVVIPLRLPLDADEEELNPYGPHPYPKRLPFASLGRPEIPPRPPYPPLPELTSPPHSPRGKRAPPPTPPQSYLLDITPPTLSSMNSDSTSTSPAIRSSESTDSIAQRRPSKLPPLPRPSHTQQSLHHANVARFASSDDAAAAAASGASTSPAPTSSEAGVVTRTASGTMRKPLPSLPASASAPVHPSAQPSPLSSISSSPTAPASLSASPDVRPPSPRSAVAAASVASPAISSSTRAVHETASDSPERRTRAQTSFKPLPELPRKERARRTSAMDIEVLYDIRDYTRVCVCFC